jgi:hypothetical protein
MSEETPGIEQLIKLMQEIHSAVQTLTSNQERLVKEQDRAGKAIGEAGAVLKTHAQILQGMQDCVVKLWREAGLPVDESQPPPQIN